MAILRVLRVPTLSKQNYQRYCSLKTAFQEPIEGASPLEVLLQKINKGELLDDSKQRQVCEKLEQLHEQLESYTPPESGLFTSFFSPKKVIPTVTLNVKVEYILMNL
ncbi:uncharacterized protein LOC108732343 isoform X2 [Agrilus planipennis]|uniref:Uncharacterized protein LOC108732343 isoform X2 n=1 Tax=Agrilus planipennis TaxID=224129 RepID=A0A1W4WEQ1_AGRPL|nr:uncharacterized protein LOC108732343 isoform X2 [Agrilus planipennis]